MSESSKGLPEFLIIGAARCGTTYLRECLSHHPAVFTLDYHVNFFNRHFERSLGWYASLFPADSRIKGEKSPNYIWDLDSHERIARCLPGAHLILLLRDPVTRAYSHWQLRKEDGRLLRETLAFNARFGNSLRSVDFAALAEAFEELRDDDARASEKPLDLFKRGCYVEQVDHLLRYVPLSRLVPIYSEDLFRDPVPHLEHLRELLELQPPLLPLAQRVNAGSKRPRLPGSLDQLLRAYYRPFDLLLEKRLGARPPWLSRISGGEATEGAGAASNQQRPGA